MDPVGTTVRVGHQHNTAQQKLSNTDRLLAADQQADEVAESARGLIAQAKQTNQSPYLAERALAKAQQVTAHVDRGFNELGAIATSSNPASSAYHTVKMTGERKKAEAGAKQAESLEKAQERQMKKNSEATQPAGGS